MSEADSTLDLLFSTVLDAAIAIREDGSIVAWNEVAERTFGWTLDEVRGLQLGHLIIPPELRAGHHNGMERFLVTGIRKVLGTRFEVSAMDRKGRRFRAELSTTELRQNSERLFVGFIRDISSRIDAEANLEKLTRRLEVAINSYGIGVFETDVLTGSVEWNDNLARIYGYSPQLFRPSLKFWRKHVFEDDLSRVDRAFDQAIANQVKEVPYSYRITRKDGAMRHIEASAHFFYDNGGFNVRRVGVNIDVTDLKTVERRLATTQDELIHVSRLNSLGAMASSLAHELNQPLQNILNYVDAAKHLIHDESPIKIGDLREALDRTTDGAIRAGELIKRLRIMASKGRVHAHDFSLKHLVKDTANIAFHDKSNNNIRFKTIIDHNADLIFGDPILIQQVLFNLIRNATEALEGALGIVTVRVSAHTQGTVLIEVSDTGPGFDPIVESRLFDTFVTTKNDGMGVGLSICRTIIERSDGQIWANSTDKGTTISFTLPRGGQAPD